MAMLMQVRGTQLDAYYARFAASVGLQGTVAPAVTNDTAAGIFCESSRDTVTIPQQITFFGAWAVQAPVLPSQWS
jgi:hypothetical protein